MTKLQRVVWGAVGLAFLISGYSSYPSIRPLLWLPGLILVLWVGETVLWLAFGRKPGLPQGNEPRGRGY